jgi:hypothetical protein
MWIVVFRNVTSCSRSSGCAMAFEYKVLERILGHEKEQAKGGRRKLCNWEF